jgi:hypothetical protein
VRATRESTFVLCAARPKRIGSFLLFCLALRFREHGVTWSCKTLSSWMHCPKCQLRLKRGTGCLARGEAAFDASIDL